MREAGHQGSHQLVAVLVNWNGGERMRSCIKALGANGTRRPDHIVLVDNASTDGVAQDLVEAPSLTVIRNETNRGFAAAANQGIAVAAQMDAEFVFLMNDDASLRDETLEELLAAADRHPNGALFGGRILDGPGERIWCAGVAVGLYANIQKLIGHGELDQGQLIVEREVDAMTGCGMLIRSSALLDVGGFDEGFFVYVEDIDLSLRMREAGREVWYVPTAVMTHDASQSTGGGYSRVRKYLLAYNVVRLVRKQRSATLWAWLLLMDVILWPLLVVVSIPFGRLGAALAKGHGTFSSLIGLPLRRPTS
jgi:GT2 family glycosyltransferase